MAEKEGGILCYTEQPATTTFALPPEPENPLEYPIRFLLNGSGDAAEDLETEAAAATNGEDVKEVTIFSALSWLLPLFELAEYLIAKDVRAHLAEMQKQDEAFAKEHPTDPSVQLKKDFPDVTSALHLLPLFAKFFEEEKKMIPQHSEYYYYITKFTFPTPKGEKSVTRSKVEGDTKATFAKPVHAFHQNQSGTKGATLATSTVTNTTSLFSLLPGHDNFLVFYEKDKLNANIKPNPRGPNGSNGGGGNGGGVSGPSVTVQNKQSAFSLFNYLELDQLRFAFAAVKELLEESKTFNASDGSLSLLARRDIKKNNLSSAFCLNPKAVAGGGADSGEGHGNNASSSNNANRAGANEKPKKATNVITAPSKELVEERREIAQKRFLKSDLEEECLRRWPHTPLQKSLIFLFEEKVEGDLTSDEVKAMGLDEKRINQNKSKNRRGQKFYLGICELPLLNKKGGAARFRAPRLWNAKRDAESAAAEATLTALRNMK